jgi:hypothetical protein
MARKVSLAVHVPNADNVLRGLSAAADGVEAASSSPWMPSPATAFFTRAMGRKHARASVRGALGAAAYRLQMSRLHRCVGVTWCSLVFSVLGLCSLLCFPFAVHGFRDPLVTLALLVLHLFSLSILQYRCNVDFIYENCISCIDTILLLFLLLFRALWVPISATLFMRVVPMLWHAFLFLGLMFFFSFLLFAWWLPLLFLVRLFIYLFAV